MLATISFFIFGATFLGIFSGARLWYQEEEVMNNRLGKWLPTQDTENNEDLLITPTPSKRTRNLEKKLILAGFHRKSDFDRALRLTRMSYLMPFLLGFIFFLMGFPMPHIIAVTILLSVVFIVIPRLWLLRTIFKRRHELQKHLPDTLDLLILCLEAGMAFDSALVRVAREMQRVSTQISREFMTTNREILAGQARQEALKNLAWRTGIDDMNTIVGAVQQSIKLGTSLVRALQIQAQVLREKRRESIREKIMKTPVKLVFPLLFFIFPTLLMVILGPSLINIFRELTNVGF